MPHSSIRDTITNEIYFLIKCKRVGGNYIKYYPKSENDKSGDGVLSFNAKQNNINAIMLENYATPKGQKNSRGVHTNHDDYTLAIRIYLNQRWDALFKKVKGDNKEEKTAIAIHKEILQLAKSLKKAFLKLSIEANDKVNVNDLIDENENRSIEEILDTYK